MQTQLKPPSAPLKPMVCPLCEKSTLRCLHCDKRLCPGHAKQHDCREKRRTFTCNDGYP